MCCRSLRVREMHTRCFGAAIDIPAVLENNRIAQLSCLCHSVEWRFFIAFFLFVVDLASQNSLATMKGKVVQFSWGNLCQEMLPCNGVVAVSKGRRARDNCIALYPRTRSLVCGSRRDFLRAKCCVITGGFGFRPCTNLAFYSGIYVL